MTRNIKWQRVGSVIVLAAGVALAGCGGAGTPTATTPGLTTNGLTSRSADAPPDGNTRAEGQSGRVGIFLSATPGGKSAGHLWANILKVELIDIQEKPVTVYETQDGASVDLATLNEASGRRYALLASPAVPSGKAYVRARVTFSRAFSQFAADSPAGQMIPLSDTLAHDDKENPILSFPLTRPRDLGNGRENFVIDFDLAKMQVADGRLTPAVREGDQNGLQDLARQIPTTFIGTVQELTGKDPDVKTAPEKASTADNLTTPDRAEKKVIFGASTDVTGGKAISQNKSDKPAIQKQTDAVDKAVADAKPTQTPAPTASPENTTSVVTAPTKAEPTGNGRVFSLSLGTNRSVMVQAGEATVYDNDGAAANPTLTEGKKAAVRGILDPTTKRILAERITLLAGDGQTAETATFRGAVASVDTKNNLLTLTTTQAEGMLPAFAAVTVQMAPDAVYRSRGGLLLTADEFTAALTAQPGATVAVSGVYEPVTGTLRGRTARMEENTPGAAHEARVTGAAQKIDDRAGTFTLSSLTVWQGIAARTEDGVPVVTTVATAFRDEKGQYLAPAHFYTMVKDGQRSVQATGLYADGKLAATRLDLVEAPPAEAKKPETAAPAKDATPAKDTAPVKDVPPSDATKPDAAKPAVSAP